MKPKLKLNSSIKKVEKTPVKKKPVPKKKESTADHVEKTTPKFKSLKEVMDTTRTFKLIFSGVEKEVYYDILYDCGVRDFLMSYHYLQSRHIKMRERFEGKNVHLFIDSGAYTYRVDPKFLDYSLEDWENHITRYLRWAERNKDYIFAIANLDVEGVVDSAQVDEWNRKYFEPFMLRTGIPVCFVWHSDSSNSWDFYCKRYPYVGFSCVSETEESSLTDYKSLLRVAERNGTLVHGFGMTKTALLTQLPYYTSDSTTWMVGMQYGELNYWNGTRMSRLKKDKWKTPAMFAELEQRYSANQDLLEAEDFTEMIRINVYAFVEAEKYVITRLRSQMYWLKAKTTKRDLENLPADFFPDPDLVLMGLNEKCETLLKYAKKMNINPEYEEADLLVCSVATMLNWDNVIYNDCKEMLLNDGGNYIKKLHDTLVNRIVGSTEEMVEDLITLFKECVSGSSDKLLQLGTNFDRAQKEREHYIEDDVEYEEVEVSEGELRTVLFNSLPKDRLLLTDGENAPEITELDKEIFEGTGITPTFDERGKFRKGIRQRKVPKTVYSKKFPKLSCSTCFAASTCPEYRDGYVCAYNKLFNNFDTRNMSDVIEAMQSMASVNMGRLQRAMLFETMSGSIDPMVSQMINQNITLMNNLKTMYENTNSTVLRQTRNVRQDGSIEESLQVTNPQSMGIMEKLLSKIMPEDDKKDDVVVDSEDVTPKKKGSVYDDVEDA